MLNDLFSIHLSNKNGSKKMALLVYSKKAVLMSLMQASFTGNIVQIVFSIFDFQIEARYVKDRREFIRSLSVAMEKTPF